MKLQEISFGTCMAAGVAWFFESIWLFTRSRNIDQPCKCRVKAKFVSSRLVYWSTAAIAWFSDKAFCFAFLSMVRACIGSAQGEKCIFSKKGGPAQPKPGHIRCSWCDPDKLFGACNSCGGLARLKQLLRNMPPGVRAVALTRVVLKLRLATPFHPKQPKPQIHPHLRKRGQANYHKRLLFFLLNMKCFVSRGSACAGGNGRYGASSLELRRACFLGCLFLLGSGGLLSNLIGRGLVFGSLGGALRHGWKGLAASQSLWQLGAGAFERSSWAQQLAGRFWRWNASRAQGVCVFVCGVLELVAGCFCLVQR